ncbi:type II secretion system protein GspF [Kordiimonas sediminis]|uniref:General secretion pathway protein F n=1 Tax=Kordiimonas sediminis TaxID=1735581 RepID=A0A919E3Y2_9PROT|nr:type II secretion system inner membrane protein GspF [Kordiimonas sediminis]GHF17293.1 type II secretion system protein GspF [Kordiimonas sediminis]
MPAYNYQAFDTKGKTQKGVIAADSGRDARARLKGMHLFPISVEPARQGQTGAGNRPLTLWQRLEGRTDRVSHKDLVMVLRQLATIIATGSPVEEALLAILQQADKPSVKRVFTRMRSEVVEGRPLSHAMMAEPRSFPRHVCAMVAAAETTGDLGRVLEKIADQAEKAEEMNAKVQAALVYPAVLAVVAIGVVSILMVFVVPKVVSQFDSFGADLPVLTRLVVTVSDFLVSYGWLLLLVLSVGAVLGRLALLQNGIQRRAHRGLLMLPLVGNVIKKAESARFARTFGTLIDSGSPVTDSLRSARETLKNAFIRDEMNKVQKDVEAGRSVASALGGLALFSPMMVSLAAAGEKSGKLGQLMLSVAEYLDRDFDSFTKTALSLLEPLIVIVMGGIVGLIIMAIMLPILQLNSLVLS